MRSAGDRIRFRCDGCGEAVRGRDDCLIVRVSRVGVGVGGTVGKVGIGGGIDEVGIDAVVRLCAGCAEERETMAEHLDRIGARYFAGPAEEAEGWESLGR